MKTKLYSIVVIILMVFSNCSDDDSIDLLLAPTITFVNQDGTKILSGECIDPDKEYAIQIALNSKDGRGVFESLSVGYTINGIAHSITFTELGVQTIPVSLINGENVAQLIESGINAKANLTFIKQGDFVLVE